METLGEGAALGLVHRRHEVRVLLEHLHQLLEGQADRRRIKCVLEKQAGTRISRPRVLGVANEERVRIGAPTSL